jgi:DNA invertase Pin-like site-specific DNA recombinase
MVEQDLEPRGINFASLTEGFDTSTPGGKMVFTVLGAMAELERNVIRERTRAGLDAARAKNRFGGRPKKVSDKQLALARKRLDSGETAKTVAESIGVSRATLYRYLDLANT